MKNTDIKIGILSLIQVGARLDKDSSLPKQRDEELLEFGRILFSSLDFKHIQKKAVARLKKLLNCLHVSLYTYDQKKAILETIAMDAKGHEVHLTVAMDEFTFAGYCAHFAAVFHVKKPKDDIRFAREPESIRELDVGEFLLIPLVFNGDIVGVIKTIGPSGGSFSADDIEFAKLLVDQLAICVQNTKLFQKVHEQFVQIFAALGDAISKKDPYTGGHTKRVSMFSEMIARELNLSPQEMMDVRMAAALHDIGKIGVPDYILQKNAPLNDEEFQIMKEHPRIGYEILQHIEGIEAVASGMRYHHERPDGLGYPYGMKEGEIPLCAEIISVADTFDAMISTRPYRKGLPPMMALEEIVKNAGTQFSPVVVEAFKNGFKKTSMYRVESIPKIMTNIKKAS